MTRQVSPSEPFLRLIKRLLNLGRFLRDNLPELIRLRQAGEPITVVGDAIIERLLRAKLAAKRLRRSKRRTYG